MRVAIAGASGFVGQALIESLRGKHELVALGRSAATDAAPGVEGRACDLFNLRDAETALEGVDAAFYLVHSMMASARLTQGDFSDLDLVCADNFARAAQKAGVKRIVYLGGLLPAASLEDLSRHLESRLEVERALGSRGVPLITLRAGMLIGGGGSSFQIMYRLVKHLPFMLGPRWTRSLSQSIDVDDAVKLLAYALEHPELAGRAWDIGCPDVLSYADMLRATGEAMSRHTRVVSVPLNPKRLSLWWVTLITGASPSLVLPLVESLKHDMVVGDGLALQKQSGIDALPLKETLEKAVREQARIDALPAEHAPSKQRRGDSRVRSVQRLPLPPGRDAIWVAEEFTRWLPRFMRPFLRVDVDADRNCRFYAWPLRAPLLELTFAKDRSASDRQLFFVTGGLLARTPDGNRARLEFRTVIEGRFVLSAIHDFEPRLPWFVYASTQALVHLLVMTRFGKHLERDARAPPADLNARPSDPSPVVEPTAGGAPL